MGAIGVGLGWLRTPRTHAAHSRPYASRPPTAVFPPRRCNGSLARKAVKELLSQKLIRPILTHKHQNVYTRASHQ